ncbi:unnamed protein product [Dimorphilus gyrociliatus]|uniref:Uncharacterized protein n=1 Tax=Dimorphilus gyrociliatus TaxID=2664684 RepID=A0A7I8V8U3_9ANNE|nr:unnamed protein product [Dimorphilus gyrociliatus]
MSTDYIKEVIEEVNNDLIGLTGYYTLDMLTDNTTNSDFENNHCQSLSFVREMLIVLYDFYWDGAGQSEDNNMDICLKILKTIANVTCVINLKQVLIELGLDMLPDNFLYSMH